MPPPPRRGERSGNVTAFPGVDLQALLRGQAHEPAEQGRDDAGSGPLFVPRVRHEPVPLDRPGKPLTFRVRVELDGVEPVVWRELELAGDLDLGDLHGILQAAMGWTDSHLHAFVMGPGERDDSTAPFATRYDLEEGERGVPEDEVRLDEVVGEVGDLLHYDYDFGDGWEHVLTVEAVQPRVEDAPRATCVDGARACPPEDVGGVPGYEEVLGWLSDGPVGDWAEEKLAWLPEGFDPAVFDVAGADAAVRAAAEGRGDGALAEGTLTVLERLGPEGAATVEPWVVAATRVPTDVDHELAAHLVAPWTALLAHVDGGLTLTGAGYLPPASVAHLVAELDAGGRLGLHADIAFGKRNREEHVRPVGTLRTSAVAVGLVRKIKGVLRPTALGLTCRTDPHRLLLHLASRLPLGRHDHERHAAQLSLLAAAAGATLRRGELGGLLGSAGWRVADRSPEDWVAVDWARPTTDVLHLAGWNPGRGHVLRHDPRASLLAVLAVLGPA